jgi:predicted protein tyrosine phosphatase
MRILFICTENLLRSPTAERVFSRVPSLECASAGLSVDAENQVVPELLEWADKIFVMGQLHTDELAERFEGQFDSSKVVCLEIPDKYDYMEPELVRVLLEKVPPHLAGKRDAK